MIRFFQTFINRMVGKEKKDMNKYQHLLTGEIDAFDQMYRQYYPLVYKFQKKYYLKGFDQEDWLQEGRIIFYKSLENYEDTHQVTIGKFFKRNFENHIRSLVRKQCATKRTVDMQAVSLEQKVESQGEAFVDCLHKEEAGVLDQLIIREKLEQLPVVLSPFERTTFQEYISGKDLRQIATDQDAQQTTVRSAYDRAKKKLKTIIYD